MYTLKREPARAWIPRLGGWFLIACFTLLPAASAAKFKHAKLGPIEIYTSDSAEETRRFLAELLEVRRVIQELVAPVPLPNPRMQILVFSRQEDYVAFLPERSALQTEKITRISGFTPMDFALVAATVREGEAAEFGQATIRYFYAAYLLNYAVPRAPEWVQAGLPEVLASIDCSGGKLYIGGDFMDHRSNVRPSKLRPLAELMDDAVMGQFHGAARHDNVLYHESWALWHQWLTGTNTARREQVRRLFGAIRSGRSGDVGTVAEIFGESPAVLEAARHPPQVPRGFPVVVSNPDAASLTRGLEFAPATELDGRFAQALLAASTGKGPGAIGYDLYRLDRGEPPPARVPEALAVMAMAENDVAGALERWERARDRGTENPYAYLAPVKEALEPRTFYFSLQPQLPSAQCGTWRELLARCVALDPGFSDAWYYRAVLEAFAPEPQAAAVEQLAHSGIFGIRPYGQVYLAIAQWRLGQHAEAHRNLKQVYESGQLTEPARAGLNSLEELMRKRETSGP